MKKSELKKQVVNVYNEKGLNGVYNFLKKEGINFKKNVVEFGLHTSKSANEEKNNWVNLTKLKFHYYSIGIKCRKTGYNYNRIRGIEISF